MPSRHTFLNPADPESFGCLQQETAEEMHPISKMEVEELAKVWSEFDALRAYFLEHPRLLEALQNVSSEKEFQNHLTQLVKLYNRAQRLLSAEQHFVHQPIEEILQKDPLWHHLVLNKDLLLHAGSENMQPLLDILKEYVSPVPKTASGASSNTSVLKGSPVLKKESALKASARRSPANSRGNSSPRDMRRIFRFLLSGLVFLGVTQSAPLKDPGEQNETVGADAIAEKVLKKTAKEALQQKPRESTEPVPTPVPTVALPQDVQDALVPSEMRQKLQQEAKAQVTPFPAATPVVKATNPPSSSPKPQASSAIHSAVKNLQQEKLFSFALEKLREGASMDGLAAPENFKETHMYISPAANFVGLASLGKGESVWHDVEQSAEPQTVMYTVEQNLIVDGYVGHVLNTRPDPASFTTLDGDTVSVRLQRDQWGNYRIQNAGEPQPLRYNLVHTEEKEAPYTLTPQKKFFWSQQTETLLTSLKNESPAVQVEALRAYIQQNGKYSQSKEHFEKYARDMRLRDQHMIMDCDVANELLAEYLRELGFQFTSTTGYQDSNKDGALVAAELHGINRVILPDGTVLYPDATPRRPVDDEQASYLAKHEQDLHNPLLEAKFADREDELLMMTGFEKALQTLWDTLAPLADGARRPVYESILKRLDSQLLNISNDDAYLYDWVYKEMLVHGWAVGAYPEAVYRRISAPDAPKKAALSVNFNLPGKTFQIYNPVDGASHFVPAGHLPYARSAYRKHQEEQDEYGLTAIQLHPNFIKEKVDINFLATVKILADGRYFALFPVQKVDSKKFFRTAWMGSKLIYLSEMPEKEMFSGINGGSMSDVRDSDTGASHVLTRLNKTETAPERWFFDETPTTLPPDIPGIEYLEELTVSKTKLSGIIRIRTSTEDRYALLRDNTLFDTFQGEQVQVVVENGGANSHRIFQLGTQHMGFMPDNTPITSVRVQGQEESLVFVSKFFSDTLYWVSEKGTWGTYDNGTMTIRGTLPYVPVLSDKEPGRVDSKLGAVPFLWNDALYTGIPGKQTEGPVTHVKAMRFTGDTLYERSPVHRAYVYTNAKSEGLLLPDGAIIDTILGVTPKQLSFECWDTSCERGLGVMQDTKGHAVVFKREKGQFVELFVSPVPVEEIQGLMMNSYHNKALISMKEHAKEMSMITVDWGTTMSRVNGYQRIGQENIHNAWNYLGSYEAYAFHDDGTFSLKSEDGYIFHGLQLKEGDDLARFAQKRFPGRSLADSPQKSDVLPVSHCKVSRIYGIVPFGRDLKKVALHGKCTLPESEESLDFILTSDDLWVFPRREGEEWSTTGLTRKQDGTLVGWVNPAPGSELEVFTIEGRTRMPLKLVDVPVTAINDIVFLPYNASSKRDSVLVSGMESETVGSHPVVVWREGGVEQVIRTIDYQSGKKKVHSFMRRVAVTFQPDGTPKVTAESSRKKDEEQYVYLYGKWYAESSGKKTNIDLVEELKDLMPPALRLSSIPADMERPQKELVEDLLNSIRVKATLDMTSDKLGKLLKQLTPASLRFIKNEIGGKDPFEEFLWKYLLRGKGMLMDTGISPEVILSQIPDEEFQRLFEEAMQEYVKDRSGY